jgi:tetratricopeptide (TPR) repeat protein
VSDYQDIALKLGVDLDLPRNEMLVEVCKAIQKQPQWVLILDNANDVVLFGKKEVNMSTNLLKYIPRAVRGTILWTTRNRAIGNTPAGFALNIIVSVMKATEAMELLGVDHATQTIEERFVKNTLLAELEWHTLAVYQAAAYMRTTSTRARQYLAILRSNSIRLGVNQSNTPDEHGESDPYKGVLKTTQIAINWLAKHDSSAYKMLHVVAYFHHRNIPPQILEGSDNKEELKATRVSGTTSKLHEISNSSISNAKYRLLDFGFITQRYSTNVEQKRYDMHELVQEAVRSGLRIDIYFRYDPGDVFLTTALQTLEDIAGYTAPERRMKENYSAHVAEVAKWSSGIGRTIETAERLTRLSNIFFSARQWAQAEPLLTSALNIQYKLLGNDNPKTVMNMADLGLAYYGQGRYGDAQSLQVRALGVSTKRFGVKHLNTVRIMMSLARTYQVMGQMDQAELLAKDAVELYKEVLGYTHPESILGMELLASMYDQKGRVGDIEALYRDVMNHQRRQLGAKDPRTLEAMGKLAIIWSKIGREDDAIELMGKCYELRKDVLGPDHPETQECMEFLEDWKSKVNALLTPEGKKAIDEGSEGEDEDTL